jgi:hypothetical protein
MRDFYKLYLYAPLLSSVSNSTFKLGLSLLAAFVATETRMCPSQSKLQMRILKENITGFQLVFSHHIRRQKQAATTVHTN